MGANPRSVVLQVQPFPFNLAFKTNFLSSSWTPIFYASEFSLFLSLCNHFFKKKKHTHTHKRMRVNPACLSLFFLPHWLAFYWFPCPRSRVETRFLCSRSCLFVFCSHLATESLRELSQTIATYMHLYHVVEVFPAIQPSLSFLPGALITRVEKIQHLVFCLWGNLACGKVTAQCFPLSYLSSY